MKKILVFLVVVFVLSLAGSVFAFDGEETPPLFYLVAGSYQNSENAHNQQKELLDAGYSSELLGYPVDGTLYWRVIVAQDPKKENLEETKRLLEKKGFSTFYAYDSESEAERPADNPDPIPIPKPKEKNLSKI